MNTLFPITTKSEATRYRLIKSTLTMIQRYGFRGAGVSAILNDSGLPKGSLYFHFPGGKDELVAEALRLAAAEYQLLIERTFKNTKRVEDAVDQIILTLAEIISAGDFQVGCPVSAVSLDVSVDSEPLRILCADIYSEWVDQVSQYLIEAGYSNEKMLASSFISLLEGALIVARAQRSTAPLIEAGRMITLLLAVQVQETSK